MSAYIAVNMRKHCENGHTEKYIKKSIISYNNVKVLRKKVCVFMCLSIQMQVWNILFYVCIYKHLQSIVMDTVINLYIHCKNRFFFVVYIVTTIVCTLRTWVHFKGYILCFAVGKRSARVENERMR